MRASRCLHWLIGFYQSDFNILRLLPARPSHWRFDFLAAAHAKNSLCITISAHISPMFSLQHHMQDKRILLAGHARAHEPECVRRASQSAGHSLSGVSPAYAQDRIIKPPAGAKAPALIVVSQHTTRHALAAELTWL